jgi:hypothetical protein
MLSVVGCNEVYTPTTAPFSLTVQSFDPEPSNRLPLEAVEVCQMDTTDNCQWTDADGKATLMLPIGETAYTLDAEENYGSYLVPRVVPPGGSGQAWSLPTNELFADRHDDVNAPYPMILTGTIIISVEEPRAGTTFELVDATGTAFYADEEGQHWDPDLTATTSGGRGGFAEVSPGEFQVRIGGTGEECWVGSGWPGDDGNSMRLPVREGYITRVVLGCPVAIP